VEVGRVRLRRPGLMSSVDVTGTSRAARALRPRHPPPGSVLDRPALLRPGPGSEDEEQHAEAADRDRYHQVSNCMRAAAGLHRRSVGWCVGGSGGERSGGEPSRSIKGKALRRSGETVGWDRTGGRADGAGREARKAGQGQADGPLGRPQAGPLEVVGKSSPIRHRPSRASAIRVPAADGSVGPAIFKVSGCVPMVIRCARCQDRAGVGECGSDGIPPQVPGVLWRSAAAGFWHAWGSLSRPARRVETQRLRRRPRRLHRRRVLCHLMRTRFPWCSRSGNRDRVEGDQFIGPGARCIPVVLIRKCRRPFGTEGR
jgi:hypothetical protein